VGIADTGSLGIVQSRFYPRLFSTLPPINIMILESDKIVRNKFEAAHEMTKKGMPGYFVYISGPSCTADIERVLTLGVHGPGRLIIMLVDKEVG
jgi:L-lactate dehydrogenase complex protein LldG